MNRVFYVALGIVLGGTGCVFHTGPSRNEVMTSRRKDVKRCVPAQNENVKIWDNLSKYSFDYNGLKAEVQKLKGLERLLSSWVILEKNGRMVIPICILGCAFVLGKRPWTLLTLTCGIV